MSKKKTTRSTNVQAKRRKRKTPEPANAPAVAQLLNSIDGHATRINHAHSILLSVFRDHDTQLAIASVHSLLDHWMWEDIDGLRKELRKLRKAVGEPADSGEWNDIDGNEDDDQ